MADNKTQTDAATEKAAPTEKTAKFKVLTPVQHDLEEYEPGATLALTAKQAKALLDVGAIEPAGAKAAAEKDVADA